MSRVQKKERILKVTKEKYQVTYKGKPTSITIEILKARKAWADVFQALKQNNCPPRLLFPAKLSCKVGEKGPSVICIN
jgi:hypothetical protein